MIIAVLSNREQASSTMQLVYKGLFGHSKAEDISARRTIVSQVGSSVGDLPSFPAAVDLPYTVAAVAVVDWKWILSVVPISVSL